MPSGRRAVHSGIDECYCGELDNTAKLFPAITDAKNSNVFGCNAELYDDVIPEILEKAVSKALSIMPSFALKISRGLFWYYFDENDAVPKIRETDRYPCSPIYKVEENGFLFRVSYYRKRINFEVYHALTDGMGALKFMRLIVYCYFNELYPDDVPEELARFEIDDAVRSFDEDSFAVNVPKGTERRYKERRSDAFRIGGYRYEGNRLGVLAARMPTEEIRVLAKKNGATLSEYLCALLIYSIYNTSYKRSLRTRPIVISIPVNLRGMFESNTLRNFFGQMNVSVKPERNADFSGILAAVRSEFEKLLTQSYFEKQIAGNVNIERIPGIRFVPLFIKDAVMRFLYRRRTKYHTMTFSNLGRITLPEQISDKVKSFEVLIGSSSSHPKKASLCSYKNELVLTFTSTVSDNSVEQYMLSYLAGQGIEITVSSNETPKPYGRTRDKDSKKADNDIAEEAEA